MIISNINIDQLNKALELTNKEFDNNAIYNNFQQLSQSRFRVTLRVKDSHKPGARLGFCLTSRGNRRHLTSACWHLYGRFIDFIFELEPKARVQTNGNTFYSYNWEWIDRNIGSMMNPLYYSEACECGYGGIKNMDNWRTRALKQEWRQFINNLSENKIKMLKDQIGGDFKNE